MPPAYPRGAPTLHPLRRLNARKYGLPFVASGCAPLPKQTQKPLLHRAYVTQRPRRRDSASPAIPTPASFRRTGSILPPPMSVASVTTAKVQERWHVGHSHHGHQHDNAYLTSSNRHDAGVRITRIGLYVNVLMAVGKGIGGYVFHSQALSADAVHSLTDLISDVMTLATVSWALKPPSERFPLGYGKFESLGSLGVSSLLLVGGVLMGWSSLVELCHLYLPAAADVLESLGLAHGHSHSHQIPNIQAAWLAGGSVAVKEWLYRATMKVARERKSSVLEANAVHHRVDSLTGIAALLSIALSNIFPQLSGCDALGGLFISYMVIRAGYGNTYTSLVELADAGVDADVKAKVDRAALKALQSIGEEVIQVRRVQGVKAGQSYLLEIELGVKGGMTIDGSRAVEDAVRTGVGQKVRGARRVRIRFVPVEGEDDLTEEFISPSVSARSSPDPESQHGHEHGHAHAHGHAHEQRHEPEHEHEHHDVGAHTNGDAHGNAGGLTKRK